MISSSADEKKKMFFSSRNEKYQERRTFTEVVVKSPKKTIEMRLFLRVNEESKELSTQQV